LEFKAFGVGEFLKDRRNWFLPRKSRNTVAPHSGDEFRKAVLAARKRTDEIELQDAVLADELYKRREPIRALSLLFRYGENSGDSMHAQPHFCTSCHYQIFF